jgi:regulator of replication initiation timing
VRSYNALAIRVLCEDLDKHNGAAPHDLKEDICETLIGIDDPELLTQTMESTASQLQTATAGQYVDRDNISGQFYLRTEGGINIPQIVRDYAETVLKRSPDSCDEYFFQFLQYVLAIQQNPYRTGFQIWQHNLEWIDKKSFRPGYIFFGNPNERSTTEPIQQYYLFFCPVFAPMERNDEQDEVYFDFTGLSDSFKDQIMLLGAAKAKFSDASSDQKSLFDSQIKEHQKKALELFEREFVERTSVLYKGASTPLKSYQLPGEGSSKKMIFSSVAAKVLNKHFSEKYPEYPAFTDLTTSLTADNFDKAIKSALRKLINSDAPNREGEAILSGLRLLGSQSIDTRNSPYAEAVRKKLKAKGQGKVLNRDEVLYAHYAQLNYWYSVDHHLDFQLEFIVLAAMVYKGDIELTWSGNRVLNATTIESQLQSISEDDMFTFQTIREPVGIPIKALKALFHNLGLPDKSADLDKAETLSEIRGSAEKKVNRVVTLRNAVQTGLKCRTIDLLSPAKSTEYAEQLGKLSEVLDEILQYNTFGKLRAFKLTEDELDEAFKGWALCDSIEQLQKQAEKFETLIGYLNQAQSYVVESQKPLYEDMDKAIAKLGSVLQTNDSSEFKRYETELNGLIDQYAEYYLDQYAKCRLSYADNNKKEAILSSDTKKVCDVIQDIELLNKVEYQNWINSITVLKPAKADLTKVQVKQEPYHDFNPREYYNKPTYTIRDLATQLDAILENWSTALRSIFKDPSVKANIDILDADDQQLIDAFRDGSQDITPQNAATLRKLIGELSKGFERISIQSQDLRKVMNKPMTIDQAKAAIDDYLDDLAKGKDRSKVRIIFSEEK